MEKLPQPRTHIHRVSLLFHYALARRLHSLLQPLSSLYLESLNQGRSHGESGVWALGAAGWLQDSMRERHAIESEREGREEEEGHLHKTCKNAQKASSYSSSSSRESTCRVRPTLKTAEKETFQLNTEALLPNREHVEDDAWSGFQMPMEDSYD